MLPTFWQTQYEILLTHLQTCQSLVDSEVKEANQLKSCFDELKKHFYDQIIMLKADDVDLSHRGQWQSLQTELYRMMRLMETDMLFLQSSRQTVTRQSRLQQMSDRLNAMIRFCREILKLE